MISRTVAVLLITHHGVVYALLKMSKSIMSETTKSSRLGHHRRTVVVAPKERIDTYSAPRWRTQLNRLYEEGATHFVIDLAATPAIDSAGMAVLVNLLLRCRRAGGEVTLCNVHAPAIQRMLRLTSFDQVFPVIDQLTLES